MQRRSANTPSSVSLPPTSQSTTTTTTTEKRIQRPKPLPCSTPILIILATTLVYSFFIFYILRLKSSEESLQSTSTSLQTEFDAIIEKVYIAESERTNAEVEFKSLQSKHDQLTQQLKQRSDEGGEGMMTSEEMDEMKERDEILQVQVENLTKEIQSISRREVEEKFGPGPHRVEITLKFPPNAPGDPNLTSFTIELAPLNLMPHSVYLFLNWIYHGLLKGCAFHRNARHVIQAGPMTNSARKQFKTTVLKSVSFQEYHPEFPHVKYTLGFAGRPGGPDWYVSTLDNTKNHGPGGQTNYKMKSEADPCFGKVIKGFEVVDRVHSMEVEEGGYKRLKEAVEIEDARIL